MHGFCWSAELTAVDKRAKKAVEALKIQSGHIDAGNNVCGVRLCPANQSCSSCFKVASGTGCSKPLTPLPTELREANPAPAQVGMTFGTLTEKLNLNLEFKLSK